MRFFGPFPCAMFLVLALCSCASQEITVEFQISDVQEMNTPSVSVDVMVIDTDMSKQNELQGKLGDFNQRMKWFLESSTAFNEIRNSLNMDKKYHRVLIDRNTSQIAPIKLHVGKKRDSTRLMAVMMVKDSETPVEAVEIGSKDVYRVKIMKNSVSVKVKDS